MFCQFQTAIDIASTLPLNTLKIKLSSYSLGIAFSRTMEFARSAISSLLISEDAFSISVTTPEGPEALTFFILQIDFTTISLVIRRRGPSNGSAVDRSSSRQGNS